MESNSIRYPHRLLFLRELIPISMKRLILWHLFSFLCFALRDAAQGGTVPAIRNVKFAQIGERTLEADLYLPDRKSRPPLIVWIHGGAWRGGSKNGIPLGKLLDDGYAICSVDYRLSTEAKFPTQIHDIKAAIRFLRAHGEEWHLATAQIVVAGDSAGGHLAALVGVSNGVMELEGKVGECRNQSSDVQGVISFYGAANLTTILKQSTPHGLSVRIPALDLLLGGQPESLPELARLASPVYHVDQHDPPLLLLHGDQDEQMPVNQSLELFGAYKKAKASVQLEIVHGAGHGGAMFYDDERLQIVRKFLNQYFPN
ncbi:MAG: nlhH 5 [Verrucomicrobiales bacterium]|nr:nlhH 5 [Verrucomicrobiales bacterium]